MAFGLTTPQALSIAAPLIGSIITAIIYVFQYDKQEYTRIATLAESERWDDTKAAYGRLVSRHYTLISNNANLFINLNDPEDSAETMIKAIDETDGLQKIYKRIEEMNQPKTYYSRCRRGAEWAPIVFVLSTGAAVGTLFLEADLYHILLLVTIGLFFLGSGLAALFLYYRAKLNKLADEVQFRA